MPSATTSPPELFVNDGPLDPARVGTLKPSSPTEGLDVLRKRYDEDGYLFLKGLLPRDDVLAARANYFNSMAPTGVLEPGTEPVEGIFNKSADPRDYPNIGAGAAQNGRLGTTSKASDWEDRAVKAHTDEWYVGSADGTVRGFTQHPVMRDFVARFTGWGDATLGLRRTLLRNNCPTNRAIGVHYDQIFLRHGEPTSVTAWVPLGDIDIRGGGIIYLEGGNELGQQIEGEFEEKAKSAGMSEEEMKYAFNKNMMGTGFLCDGPADFGGKYGRRWLVTAYEAGDVVLHKPHAVRSPPYLCSTSSWRSFPLPLHSHACPYTKPHL